MIISFVGTGPRRLIAGFMLATALMSMWVSNTATAIGSGVEPMILLIAAAIAASCAFMLPVATPPNAIVFSSGQVTIFQMIKAGFWLNLIGVVIVTGLMYLVGGVVLGLGTS